MTLRRFLKILKWTSIILVFLLVLCYILIHLTPVQNWLVDKVADRLSKELHTKVEVKEVDFDLFNKMHINGVLVEDLKKDTLLYAGQIKVNITDWFFFKDKATLHYISLNDVTANLNRSDSTWNYNFLAEYFGSGGKSSSDKKASIAFDFKDIYLYNVRLNQKDAWIGKDTYFEIGLASIKANNADLNNKNIDIETIALTNPVFSELRYTGNKSKLNLPPRPKSTAAPKAFQWNNDGWVIQVKELKIDGGNMKIDKETERERWANRFDGQHLLFEKLNGSFRNLHFEKDTLRANINLAAKEQSGFEIKKLEALLKFTPELMEFDKLNLLTNRSRLQNYYAMKFDDFSGDFGDYIHEVTMDGRFTDSELDSEDLAFFAPKAAEWKRVFYINGTAGGTVDNLRAGNMKIRAGNTTLDGNLVMRGLPDINETFIDFTSNNLQTNHSDISVFVPSLKKVKELSGLGGIRFRGNFTGFINDFVTYGTTQTALGTITTDLNMKLPEGKTPSYSGKINTDGFNLGRLLKNTSLGNLAVDGSVKGSGFSVKNLKANFKGVARRFYLSGYEYQNLDINGSFEKELFTGNLNINDPNLVVKNLDGTISLSGKQPQYRFSALLEKASLKNLKLTQEDFTLDGSFKLDFSGNNIDNFLGSAQVTNARLFNRDRQLSFEFLSLQSLINSEGDKQLDFKTNELDGNITGRFKIAELPDAFKLFLSNYYPAYIPKPKNKISNQDFSFTINTKNLDGYTQLLDKKLGGFNNSVINGKLQLSSNTFYVDADVPEFSYDGKIFRGTRLISQGSLDSLSTDITLQKISISDSLSFPASHLAISTSRDRSHVSISTRASKTLNEASLNAMVTTLPDGVSIDFEPSSFIINDSKWELEKQGNLTIQKKLVDASEIKFVNGSQEIVISTRLSPENEEPEVVAALKEVHIDDLSSLFLRKQKLDGILTGELVATNVFSKPGFQFTGKARDFVFNGKMIGTTLLDATYDTRLEELVFNGSTEGKNDFDISGRINMKDSTENQIGINMTAQRIDLNIIEPYLSGIFSNLKGNALANLSLNGNGKRQYLTGVVTTDSASLLVNYTQCRYQLGPSEIRFEKDEINLGNITLIDQLGNRATASGRLYHSFFNDFYFDNVRFAVNNPGSSIPGTGKFLVLNTTKKDNSSFYGRVIGDATTTMELNGPVTDMKMDIAGAPSINDSSYIKLLTGVGRETGKIDYIDFIQYGTKMDEVFGANKSAQIVVNLNMQANPACKVDVVLDEATNDVISGQGNGNLFIRVGNKEAITMNGRFDITEGKYNFNFQTVLNKDFIIDKGSITWNGDPYDAQINIDATYTAQNVNLSSLSSSSGNLYQKNKLFIISHLTNTLKAPKISFEFKLPAESDPGKDLIVQENLRKFQQDENEMNKQVFSLLMFNSFLSNNEIRNSLPAFLGGTVGQLLSGYLNTLLVKAFRNTAVMPYFNFNTTYDGTVSPEFIKALQASGSGGLQWQLLDGRLRVAFGGTFDVNNPYVFAVRNTNVLITPDLQVEWLLTKDGSWRLVGFNRTNIDQTFGQRNKTGVKISHHVEFDKPRKPKIKK